MFLTTWKGLQTHMWHHLHSFLRHNWQYLWFFTYPPIFLPIQNRFHPSKWRVGGSLHKAFVFGAVLELKWWASPLVMVDWQTLDSTNLFIQCVGYQPWVVDTWSPLTHEYDDNTPSVKTITLSLRNWMIKIRKSVWRHYLLSRSLVVQRWMEK